MIGKHLRQVKKCCGVLKIASTELGGECILVVSGLIEAISSELIAVWFRFGSNICGGLFLLDSEVKT